MQKHNLSTTSENYKQKIFKWLHFKTKQCFWGTLIKSRKKVQTKFITHVRPRKRTGLNLR